MPLVDKTIRPRDLLEEDGSLILKTGAVIWVCSACGKTTSDPGGPGRVTHAGDEDWDESCYLHAVLCHNPPAYIGDAGAWDRHKVQWMIVRRWMKP